jgi:hypothetical protein
MSRVRWGLGTALAAVALLASLHALWTYAGRGLWLGALAVLVLLGMDVAGMFILWRARTRLAHEWAAMNATSPSGELVDARRRALQAIRDAGGLPHADALAEATAAAEHGNAYLGRYMVAVTVLVGLVGTFAGLMETLRHVAPLLTDEKASALQVIAAPLAGLDVTFGASVVGILVTLALSLVQGDLMLAEDAVLARLEDLSAHLLVPSIWPHDSSPDARVAFEMAALRKDMASLMERMAEASAERVAKVADAALERQAAMLERVVSGVLTQSATQVKDGLLGVAASVDAQLVPLLRAQSEQALKAGNEAREASAQAQRAMEQTSRTVVEGLSTLSKALVGQWDGALKAQLDAVQASSSAMVDAQAKWQAALSDESKAAVRARGDEARQWKEALAQSAAVLVDAQKAWQVALSEEAQATRAARSDGEKQWKETLAQSAAVLVDAQKAWQVALSDEAQATRATRSDGEKQWRETLAQSAAVLVDAQKAWQAALSDETRSSAQARNEEAAQWRTALQAIVEETTRRLAQDTGQIPATVNAAVDALVTATRQAQQGMQSAVENHALAVEASTRELPAVVQAATQRMAAATEETRALLGAGVETLVETQRRLGEDSARSVETLVNHAEQAGVAVEQALSRVLEQHAQELRAATTRITDAVGTSFGEATGRLDAAAEHLAQAANQLREGTAVLAPSVAGLTPELAALSREIALMAARQDENEAGNLVLEELTRVGEGMDRLQALMKLAQESRS